MPTGQKAKSYKENMEYKRGNSWKAKLFKKIKCTIYSEICLWCYMYITGRWIRDLYPKNIMTISDISRRIFLRNNYRRSAFFGTI